MEDLQEELSEYESAPKSSPAEVKQRNEESTARAQADRIVEDQAAAAAEALAESCRHQLRRELITNIKEKHNSLREQRERIHGIELEVVAVQVTLYLHDDGLTEGW